MNLVEVTRLRRVMRAMCDLFSREKVIAMWEDAMRVPSGAYPYSCIDSPSSAKLEIAQALKLEFRV